MRLFVNTDEIGGVSMKYTAAILTVSDRCSRGVREDTTGPALAKLLEEDAPLQASASLPCKIPH